MLHVLASHPVYYMYSIVHSSDVTVRYEEEQYTAAEEDGYVTLALVLDGDAVIPVTVSVNTLDLLDSSVGDAATGELVTHLLSFTHVQCSLHCMFILQPTYQPASSHVLYHIL